MGEGKARSGMWSHQPRLEMTAPQLGTTLVAWWVPCFWFLFFSPGETKNRERKPSGLSLQEAGPTCCCLRPSQKMSLLRKQNEALALHPCKGEREEGLDGEKELAFSYCFSSSK